MRKVPATLHFIGTLMLVALVGGCGARKAEPVQTSRATDKILSCSHLDAEHQVNTRRMAHLITEKGAQEMNNVGFLILSPLFLDLSNTEQQEIRALQDRNHQLALLMGTRKCGG
ncbi:MAG: hypothetical protein DHS20C03_08460 [Minwuia thermotolerans]|nr:MAG: hypothetical protein DHS20C03_08460 [Minwuia thermotolerans]